MRKWTKNTDQTLKINVLLFDGFSNHCLANTVEPFRAANKVCGKELYAWRFLSLDGGLITSSSDMLIQTQKTSLDDAGCDFLMVISSYNYKPFANVKVLAALRKFSAKAKCVVGLDTGAWLIAAAGLLDGYTATIHSEALEGFSETFSDITAQRERYIIDRDRITCGGAMASFDLVLKLIGEQCGEATRLDVAALFLHHTAGQFDRFSTTSGNANLVSRALVLMDETIENPISIAAIANQVGCTSKDLQRRFSKKFNASPGQVYRHRRLAVVKSLVESTDLSISEIAIRCGYESASSMTRAFKQQFDVSPKALRLENDF